MSKSINIETSKGRTINVTYDSVQGHRGDTGKRLLMREAFVRIIQPAPMLPTLDETLNRFSRYNQEKNR